MTITIPMWLMYAACALIAFPIMLIAGAWLSVAALDHVLRAVNAYWWVLAYTAARMRKRRALHLFLIRAVRGDIRISTRQSACLTFKHDKAEVVEASS